MDEVLQSNAGLSAAGASTQAARFRIDPAGDWDDPMLSYGSAPATIGLRDVTYGQRIEISQSVPWPGKLDAREDAARHLARGHGAREENRRLALEVATKRVFAEWYFVHEALRLTTKARGLVEDLRDLTQSRYATDRGGQHPVLQAETELAQLDDRLLELNSDRTTVQNRINALLNRPPGQPVHAPAEIPGFSSPPLGILIATAEETHPRLKELGAEIDRRQAGVRLARLERYPDLRVNAAYNTMWAMEEHRYMIGISLSVPLDQGRRRAEISAAQAETRAARYTLADEKARLQNAVAAALAVVERVKQSVQLHRERLVPLAEQTLEAAITAYRAGQGDFLDVITAEQNLLKAEQTLARRIADRLRAVADLEEAVGRSLAESRTPRPGMNGGAE